MSCWIVHCHHPWVLFSFVNSEHPRSLGFRAYIAPFVGLSSWSPSLAYEHSLSYPLYGRDVFCSLLLEFTAELVLLPV